MARVNGTKQVALGFLTWRPMSGYDVKKIVEQSVSNFWSESFGQIYPTLRALVREGLASTVPTDVKGLRRRQVYAITEKGRAALRQWLEDPITPGPLRNELLLKLFFARQAGGEVAKKHVEGFKARMIALSRHYEAIGEQLSRERADEPDLEYWQLTLEYGRLEADAHLAWCDKAIAALERVDPDAS
jgi:DNA-binding PadR family transcriptional regulator